MLDHFTITLDGILFGLIDNGIVAVSSYWGLSLYIRFFGTGPGVFIGGIYGALMGNTISDAVAAGFTIGGTLSITIGCLIPIPFVWGWEWYKKSRAVQV